MMLLATIIDLIFSLPNQFPESKMSNPITQLGYIGFEVSNISEWNRFAAEVLGLAVLPGPTPSTLFLRMDDQDRRFILIEGSADDVAFVGWQVEDKLALQQFIVYLQTQNIVFERASADDLVLRAVQDMVFFKDPNGVRYEVYYGAQMADCVFASPVLVGEFVTGRGGAGHVVFASDRYHESIAFAEAILGAEMSDFIIQAVGPDRTMEVAFLNINERHHSIAFANAAATKALHHFMIEVDRVDEVGRARDRALKLGYTVKQDIGQHPNDQMISIYVKTPSGFLIEFGWGGRKIDRDGWMTKTYSEFSEWGHRPAPPL